MVHRPTASGITWQQDSDAEFKPPPQIFWSRICILIRCGGFRLRQQIPGYLLFKGASFSLPWVWAILGDLFLTSGRNDGMWLPSQLSPFSLRSPNLGKASCLVVRTLKQFICAEGHMAKNIHASSHICVPFGSESFSPSCAFRWWHDTWLQSHKGPRARIAQLSHSSVPDSQQLC